jgi:hypothetical protein
MHPGRKILIQEKAKEVSHAAPPSALLFFASMSELPWANGRLEISIELAWKRVLPPASLKNATERSDMTTRAQGRKGLQTGLFPLVFFFLPFLRVLCALE